jgi:thymidine phosphorylase
MSKKIAEGIGALVLDVKAGSGAFMKTGADSRRLAESLVSVGNASGVHTEAVITAMESPLGRAVGNALEVVECIEVLKGGGPPDLIEVILELAARMLVLGKAARDPGEGRTQARQALASGAALDRFQKIIEIQGGDPSVLDDLTRLPRAPERHVIVADRAGYLFRLDAELVGRASVALGAGRDRVDDPIDPAVGIIVRRKPGDEVRAGDAILELHYRDPARLETAVALARHAAVIREDRPDPLPLILGEVR